ncbi:bifunctional 4-hydroxy-2-oxoglutarate aldolase/2-dehydro-3-deoxy-phosphogluconate aldolase [Halosquirtibacter xylanolyticus]|uniref:bifunctional 4-hydroxy-2-oxoglutarate aldolase/2-dehydro-3-deoxy-phosphogluconate aldolase n=1 Tax=Halosquirtibacter xylanolyticus TaxID=3374599 RepID=UPI003748ABD8|nr:bifunctional 4-hydroxy-2-oxoglutarate aldolase/2-dehydro-3-deoxy-phosphogluconate aldolase [Prolixibacteraceae bacterium]
MARFSKLEVIAQMKETGMIPVFFHKDIEVCKNIVKACYDGGVRVFEFTNRGDFAHEVFAELVKWAAVETPEMILGIGSIVEAATAALYIQLGTNFVVAPLLHEETAKVCNRRGILWSPGCGSVTEVGRALELGSEVAKVFPGSQVGGPAFVKSVKAPMPWALMMPTGGVTPTKENLEGWFNAGVTCVGMGSQLITSEIIKEGKYAELTAQVKEAMSVIRELCS